VVFSFKEGSRIKADPQAAGKVCLQLEKKGGLTSKRLLDVSRDESAPLHNEFEWDDSIAAENFRESQAAYIIRHIVIKKDGDDKPSVRAFLNITGETREYRSLDIILNTPDLKEQLLIRAKRDMEAFIARYEELMELSAVIESMNQALAS